MARSTGPILAVGAITLMNETIVHDQAIDWRIPIATGLAAGMLALIERASGNVAVGISYLALVTLLFARTKPNVPSPIESLAEWTGIGER